MDTLVHIGLLNAVLATGLFAAPAAAQKLVLYTASNDEIEKVIMAAFAKAHPEIKVQAINRIAMQLLFAAQFPLAYLPRINAMIERLLDLYG